MLRPVLLPGPAGGRMPGREGAGRAARERRLDPYKNNSAVRAPWFAVIF